jgi:hypothetical protein
VRAVVTAHLEPVWRGFRCGMASGVAWLPVRRYATTVRSVSRVADDERGYALKSSVCLVRGISECTYA